MLNIRDLIDDARCYQTVRDLRWLDGVSCPYCSSPSVNKDRRMTPNPIANANANANANATSATAAASGSTT